MFEFLMQAAVHMGDILALLLLFVVGAIVVLAVMDNAYPATNSAGDDFATNLFNKIEEYRNDFQG